MTENVFDINSRHRRELMSAGGWLPLDEQAIARYLQEIKEVADNLQNSQIEGEQVTTPVDDFANFINANPLLRMTFSQSITQAKENRPEEFPFETVEEVIAAMQAVMTMSPKFEQTDLVGCPLNAVINWPMCTTAGFAFFRHPEVNVQIKKILQYWSATFLATEASCTYMNAKEPDGWWCPTANKKIKIEEYAKYDPTKPNGGFSSWNDFFTKEFKDGVRPIAGLTDNTVVVSPCESGPLQVVYNASAYNDFWVKGTNYSLYEMFSAVEVGGNPLGHYFVGGAVYQAFLSALHYHRWHAPVAGKVIAAYNVQGTYYSDAEYGFQDPGGPNLSQPYLSIVATRSVLVIQPEGTNKSDQLVAVIYVGMAEVSSCNLTVKAGDTLTKGQPVGFFQFGGSTHCVLFGPALATKFTVPIPNPSDAPPLKVNSQLATIVI